MAIMFGCGTSCTAGFVADVSTGQVYDFPVGGERQQNLHLEYTVGSRLLMAHWTKEPFPPFHHCLRQQFVWEGQAFALGDVVNEPCRAYDVAEETSHPPLLPTTPTQRRPPQAMLVDARQRAEAARRARWAEYAQEHDVTRNYNPLNPP